MVNYFPKRTGGKGLTELWYVKNFFLVRLKVDSLPLEVATLKEHFKPTVLIRKRAIVYVISLNLLKRETAKNRTI